MQSRCFYESCEDSMGSWGLQVHIGTCNMTAFLASYDQLIYLIQMLDMHFCTILQKCLTFVFSYLKFRMSEIKQVKDGFIVNLYVTAFDFEINLYHSFVFEDILIVEAVTLPGFIGAAV